MPGPYSKLASIEWEGLPLIEMMEVDFGVESNDKSVLTMAQGYAGDQDGAEVCEFSYTHAIPAAGREVDFVDLCATHREGTFTMRMAGKSRMVRGRFRSASEKSGVNGVNEGTGKFSGRYVRAG